MTNQEIFEENNLEVPTTWKEFLEVCKTLKEKSITPIGLMGKDPGRVGHGFQCMTVAWDPEGIEAIERAVSGEEKLENDEGFREVAEKTAELLSYTNEDVLGLADTTCGECNVYYRVLCQRNIADCQSGFEDGSISSAK